MNIQFFGQKKTVSRVGGVEIVVKELATRMSQRGHNVVCYDRCTVVEQIGLETEYEGVKIVPVWTIEKKGIAAMTSSLAAAWKATWSSCDIVHIHAEGPAAMSWMPKLRGKRVIVTIHGRDDIIEKTGRKASKIRLCDNIVSYPEHKYTFPSIPVLTAKPAYVMPESFTAA